MRRLFVFPSRAAASRLATLALVVAAASLLALPSSGGAAPNRGALAPALFSELSSGVALVRTFNCHGKAIGEGSGFLVGSSVVMTADHVVRSSCQNRIKVLLGDRWYAVAKWDYWYTKSQSRGSVDVSTLLLKTPSDGHVFMVSSSSAAKGANLSALGHPLGNDISLNQGHVVLKLKQSGVPQLAVRMLGAEGGSGSPLVNDRGDVVGILQRGYGSTDILGQRTAGLIVGIDLPSWWNGKTEKNLCDVYKDGGIPGCGENPPPPTTTTAPPLPSGPLGSRQNPWPLGNAAAAGEWTVRVNVAANFDAWAIVGQVDPSNQKPPPGYIEVLVNLTATYNGTNSGSLTDLEVLLALRGASDYPNSPRYQSCGVALHPNVGDVGPLSAKQTATVNVCTMLPTGDVAALELLVAGSTWFALR